MRPLRRDRYDFLTHFFFFKYHSRQMSVLSTMPPSLSLAHALLLLPSLSSSSSSKLTLRFTYHIVLLLFYTIELSYSKKK